MNPSAIFPQYYNYAVVIFAFYINCAHSYPNVPGREFEECFEFLQVFELFHEPVEHLGFSEEDSKHICALKGTEGQSLCFVITPLGERDVESVCHEFDLLDLKITRFKHPALVFDIAVFRNGDKRWYFDCAVSNYDGMKRFYTFMKYDSHERGLKLCTREGLDGRIDLQKRAAGASDYETFATRPSIYIEDSVANSNIVHVVDSRAAGGGPLLIMLQGTFDIHTAEGKKVYMSLRRYTEELYYFTCASSSYARQLSNHLGKYSHYGYATARKNPIIML